MCSDGSVLMASHVMASHCRTMNGMLKWSRMVVLKRDGAKTLDREIALM
jgi:hypothetical protein